MEARGANRGARDLVLELELREVEVGSRLFQSQLEDDEDGEAADDVLPGTANG